VAERIVPVILCGGAGTRLWPASTDMLPKPFLPLVAGTSTFAATLARVTDPMFGPPVIMANREHASLVSEAVAKAGIEATVLLEPEGRDTAAAIAAAAEWVANDDPKAVILVLAADHLIRDVAGFRVSVAEAAKAAAAGMIVVFGVEPALPATSYGYIRPGEALDGFPDVDRVAAFVEKPDRATAEHYVESGYLWNSGNFALTAETAVAEIREHAPGVAEAAAAAIAAAKIDGRLVELDAAAFAKAPRISFDHAVMEKTGRAAVVDARFDWSDLGTWSSVWDSADKDETGNAVIGEAVILDSRGSFVSSDRPFVGLLGVDDLMVVASDDAILVAPRDRADSVKELVAKFGKSPEKLIGDRQRHYRPWGYYQSLDVGDMHQVKRIVVKPGARLSLQRHQHRSEHWTVVQGVAEVTVGMEMNALEIKTVRPNESVYIPLHGIHRMANPGKVPMTIIEVQCGDYLGEDDIERLQDDYGRTEK
jgi:mannose-1-phosphate guanylyltransferase/mannose-6-phosphate isomerase